MNGRKAKNGWLNVTQEYLCLCMRVKMSWKVSEADPIVADVRRLCQVK